MRGGVRWCSRPAGGRVGRIAESALRRQAPVAAVKGGFFTARKNLEMRFGAWEWLRVDGKSSTRGSGPAVRSYRRNYLLLWLFLEFYVGMVVRQSHHKSEGPKARGGGLLIGIGQAFAASSRRAAEPPSRCGVEPPSRRAAAASSRCGVERRRAASSGVERRVMPTRC